MKRLHTRQQTTVSSIGIAIFLATTSALLAEQQGIAVMPPAGLTPSRHICEAISKQISGQFKEAGFKVPDVNTVKMEVEALKQADPSMKHSHLRTAIYASQQVNMAAVWLVRTPKGSVSKDLCLFVSDKTKGVVVNIKLPVKEEADYLPTMKKLVASAIKTLKPNETTASQATQQPVRVLDLLKPGEQQNHNANMCPKHNVPNCKCGYYQTIGLIDHSTDQTQLTEEQKKQQAIAASIKRWANTDGAKACSVCGGTNCLCARPNISRPRPIQGSSIKIRSAEDDGCRWTRVNGGVRLDHAMKTSDFVGKLNVGDVITRIDGRAYQPGLLTHARRKLIEDWAQQVKLDVKRGNQVISFTLIKAK